MIKTRYAITFFLTVLGSTLFAQTFRYVKPVATGTGDGATWADASADLQGMINASASGDEVWVAAGTYKPTEKLQEITYVANEPLPVNLMSYNALKNGAKSVLTWKTASQQNNQKFAIEKGSTATDFTFFKEVAGSGNSSSPITYSITDYNPLAGANYYRLTQYDYNGKATVLGVEALTFELAGDDKIKIYPNPATADVWVKAPSSSDGIVSINLISLTGRSILSNIYVNTVSKEIKLGLANIPTGTYILWVNKGKIGEEKQTLLVVK